MNDWTHFGENVFEGGIAVFLLRTVLIIVLMRVLIKLLHHFISRTGDRWQKEGINKTSVSYLEQIIKVILYLLAGVIILSGTKPLAMAAHTILGATSIATVIIGLAAQQTFSNFIAGLSLALTQPFQVGDIITVPEKGLTGIVRKITFRHTVLMALDGNCTVIVPNSVLNNAIVQNLHQSEGAYSTWISVGVAYGTDISKARKLLKEIVTNQQNTINEDVIVRVSDLGASAIELSCQVMTGTVLQSKSACSDIRETVLKRFAEAGIEIPFNQLNVRIQS